MMKHVTGLAFEPRKKQSVADWRNETRSSAPARVFLVARYTNDMRFVDTNVLLYSISSESSESDWADVASRLQPTTDRGSE